MRSNLNQYVRVRNIDSRVTNFRKNDGVYFISVSKVRYDVHAFTLTHFSADIGNLQLLSILFNGENMVTEDYDFVTSALMQSYQIVTGHVFGWIVEVKRLFQPGNATGCVVFLIELRCHFTPNFDALNACKVPSVLQINPVSLIQFGPNLKT